MGKSHKTKGKTNIFTSKELNDLTAIFYEQTIDVSKGVAKIK